MYNCHQSSHGYLVVNVTLHLERHGELATNVILQLFSNSLPFVTLQIAGLYYTYLHFPHPAYFYEISVNLVLDILTEVKMSGKVNSFSGH